MANTHDIRITDVACYFLPVETRMPLKFGNQVLTHASCARACVRVVDEKGRTAEGWGETPLSVAWTWPSQTDYNTREEAMKSFTAQLGHDLKSFPKFGHAMDIGNAFLRERLEPLLEKFNEGKQGDSAMPHLAALVSLSAYDVAIHDAYGNLHGCPVYETYNKAFMSYDLSHYIEAAKDSNVSFAGKYPQDFFVQPEQQQPVWHLVGGLDPLEEDDLTGDEPDDGYPVLLSDWIKTDGLNCLKIKLRGNDGPWDYDRIVKVGEIGEMEGAKWLTADFNCTVQDPAYVNEILDRLQAEHPGIMDRMLYVEQPFPYDLTANQIDVHSVSGRKPLFLDESAHDWKYVRLGRELGWTGVALKTCKTQTGALLSLCWAKAHGMQLMVQDLTNPMIAQIPHCLLAAYAGTIMGVESNAMQFYPEASLAEEEIHPGLYKRRNGILDLSTISGSGFGYRLERISRKLPKAAVDFDNA
jgi:L-alanine-DL-glutamate epimerase-like enolase superfamily enzyme